MHRPFFAGGNDEQKEQPKPHGKIGAGLVHHAPETMAGQFGEREAPEAMAEKEQNIF